MQSPAGPRENAQIIGGFASETELSRLSAAHHGVQANIGTPLNWMWTGRVRRRSRTQRAAGRWNLWICRSATNVIEIALPRSRANSRRRQIGSKANGRVVQIRRKDDKRVAEK